MENEDGISWDPSNWDWLNNGDDTGGKAYTDCAHPWEQINFLEGVDEPGKIALGCSTCGEVWEDNSIELLATVWQASKQELYSLSNRIEGLEKVITDKLSMSICLTCGNWLPRNSAFDLGGEYACYNHITSSLKFVKDNPLSLLRVIEYVKATGLYPTDDLHKRALYERLVAESSQLSQALENEYYNYETSPVNLSEASINLGLRDISNVNLIISSIARKCDFNIPSSRIGKCYILSLYSLACKIKSGLVNRVDIDGELLKILPSKEEERVGVAVQICFPEVDEDTQFSGDMAEEALILTSKRTLTTLIK